MCGFAKVQNNLNIFFMMAFKNSDVVKNTFCLLALRVKFSAVDIVFFFLFFTEKREKENDMAFVANCLHNTNEMSNHVFWEK